MLYTRNVNAYAISFHMKNSSLFVRPQIIQALKAYTYALHMHACSFVGAVQNIDKKIGSAGVNV